MMEGKGGCCITRWAGDHAAALYDMSKMDRIMLRFRPIAPKPVPLSEPVAGSSDSSNISNGVNGRHAKTSNRGRKKSINKENSNNHNNNNNSQSCGKRCSNGRKRKSCSPDQRAQNNHDDDGNDQDQKAAGVTLLQLFPEAPDLSPTNQVSKTPIWLNFDDDNSPAFDDNYNHCHGGGW